MTSSTNARHLSADDRATRDNLRAFPAGPSDWTVPSGTQLGVYYQLHRLADGRITCTCPAGAVAQGCKHVSAVMAAEQLDHDTAPLADPAALIARDAGRPRRQLTADELIEAKALLLGERPVIAGGQDPEHVPPLDVVQIPSRFWITRQGKDFPLYAGLLDAAHRMGLLSILTSFVQMGNDENGQTWICRAEVTLTGGRVFSGLGDAGPTNVRPAMLSVLPRMAETRAKARALRDAVNVGTAAAEELLDEGPAAEVRPVLDERLAAAADGLGSRSVADDVPRSTGGATVPQLRAVRSIAAEAGISPLDLDAEMVTRYGHPVADLSRREASEAITQLRARTPGRERHSSAPQWSNAG